MGTHRAELPMMQKVMQPPQKLENGRRHTGRSGLMVCSALCMFGWPLGCTVVIMLQAAAYVLATNYAARPCRERPSNQ